MGWETARPTTGVPSPREVLSDRPVIPNDTRVPEAKGRVTVVTGPTMSGKSAYLKSVALITYLAHVGCFVPADSCRVGLTDRIFTRIISHDSLVSRVGQSSFMRDLNQVSLMVNNATERSLCIVDEFGKGTKTSDGVGLLGGFLRFMSRCGACFSPRTGGRAGGNLGGRNWRWRGRGVTHTPVDLISRPEVLFFSFIFELSDYVPLKV